VCSYDLPKTPKPLTFKIYLKIKIKLDNLEKNIS